MKRFMLEYSKASEGFYDARLRTACLLALVWVQFQNRWGYYGGIIALVLCVLWAVAPSIIPEKYKSRNSKR